MVRQLDAGPLAERLIRIRVRGVRTAVRTVHQLPAPTLTAHTRPPASPDALCKLHASGG